MKRFGKGMGIYILCLASIVGVAQLPNSSTAEQILRLALAIALGIFGSIKGAMALINGIKDFLM